MKVRQGPWFRAGVQDSLLVLALAVLGECELFFRSLNTDFHGPRALNTVVVALIALPVAWRRRAPVVALAAFWVPVQIWLDVLYDAHSNLPLEPFIALLVLVYSAAAYESPRGERIVAGVIAALYASELVLLAFGLKGWGNVVPGLIFISASYAVGLGVRRRRLHAGSLERHAARLEIEQEELARRAVTEERDRIARELHDVIAHSVSVMVVQAGAAERLVDREPERAREALEAIRVAGGEALDELRRLLGLLRDNPAPSSSSEPQPGLGRLDRLLEQANASGLTVNCVVDGNGASLPPGVDLAAYRIVQEALTNVRKHAAGASVELQITHSRRELEVRVRNDVGRAPSSNATGPGQGLIGMRERVALYAGTLAHGPIAGGGFELQARIPLESTGR